MTTTKSVCYCGGALLAVGVLGSGWLPSTGAHSPWWFGPTLLSAGWIIAGFTMGPARWARTAIPAAVSALYALFYVADRGFTVASVGLLAVAALLNGAHLAAEWRKHEA